MRLPCPTQAKRHEIKEIICEIQKKEVLLHPHYKMRLINSINFNQVIMNHYETVFILTPVLSDEQMKETVAKFKKLLQDNGVEEFLNEEIWGLKKLAYSIQKKTSGFYCLFEFKANPEVVNKLETGYRRDEKVIRFMTVKLDKYAAQYAEKRKLKYSKVEA